jgi:uncharacterized membrane protein
MSYARQMLDAHPGDLDLSPETVAKTVDALSECAEACISDTDADLSEPNLAEMVTCIRLCEDCAEICAAAARVLSRPGTWNDQAVRPLLEACVAICGSCGNECERHAALHQHCGICAEACRRCEQACADFLDIM